VVACVDAHLPLPVLLADARTAIVCGRCGALLSVVPAALSSDAPPAAAPWLVLGAPTHWRFERATTVVRSDHLWMS
jgi:hypothetical protein